MERRESRAAGGRGRARARESDAGEEGGEGERRRRRRASLGLAERWEGKMDDGRIGVHVVKRDAFQNQRPQNAALDEEAAMMPHLRMSHPNP